MFAYHKELRVNIIIEKCALISNIQRINWSVGGAQAYSGFVSGTLPLVAHEEWPAVVRGGPPH